MFIITTHPYYLILYCRYQPIQSQRRIKDVYTVTEEIKLSLVTDDLTVYREAPRESTEKLFQTSDMADGKIHAHKLTAFLSIKYMPSDNN